MKRLSTLFGKVYEQRNTEQLINKYIKNIGLHTQAQDNNIKWLFLGPPGVGKGTYARELSRILSLQHISSGDLFREQIAKGTSTDAQQLKKYVSKGQLVPDELSAKIMLKHIEESVLENSDYKGFILDGFPRTRHQAEILNQQLKLDLALNMYLSEDILIEKALGRRICSECQENYNVADIKRQRNDPNLPDVNMPPLNPPPECKHKMIQREDDTESIILKRLQIYKDNMNSMEAFYKKIGILKDFEVPSGKFETMPILLDVLQPYLFEDLKQKKEAMKEFYLQKLANHKSEGSNIVCPKKAKK